MFPPDRRVEDAGTEDSPPRPGRSLYSGLQPMFARVRHRLWLPLRRRAAFQRGRGASRKRAVRRRRGVAREADFTRLQLQVSEPHLAPEQDVRQRCEE